MYIFVEAVFFDESVRPDRAQQFFFPDDVACVRDQCQQRIEQLGRERDGFAVSEQDALSRVEVKASELVNGLGIQ